MPEEVTGNTETTSGSQLDAATGADQSQLEGSGGGEQTNTPPADTTTPKDDPGWFPAIREDQRIDEFRQYRKFPEVLDAYIAMKDKLSRSVSIPGEGATEEEIAEYRKAMGIPEAADGYEFSDKVGDFNVPEEFRKEVAEDALAAGMSKSQAEQFYQRQAERYGKIMAEMADDYKMSRAEGEKATRKKWGAEYEQNLATSARGYKAYASPELRGLLAEAQIADHPVVMEFFKTLGETVKSDTSLRGDHVSSKPKGRVVDYSTVVGD